MTRDRVIGRDGGIPWHLSDDLKRFKRLTTGHAVLMGRKTYESLGKPLANRRNVVITSRTIPGVECFPSIDAALDALKDQDTVFVIGGGQIYTQLLPRADYLYLTLVKLHEHGDTCFPEYESLLMSYTLVHREEHEEFVFLDYARRV